MTIILTVCHHSPAKAQGVASSHLVPTQPWLEKDIVFQEMGGGKSSRG